MTSFREKVLCKIAHLSLVSFIYPGKSHDWLLFYLTLICQSRSHDFFKWPLQFSTGLSSSGSINYLKTRLFFGISVQFFFYRIWNPIFHKIGNARGMDYTKIRGARDTVQGEHPKDIDNIGKKYRWPLTYNLWLHLN